MTEDTYLRTDDLLRNLLQKPDVTLAESQPLYTFLLGSRLCISPHQLLVKLQRIATDDSEILQEPPSRGEASVCGNSPGCKVTSFYVAPGEETIRRRRRGRSSNKSKNQIEGKPLPGEPVDSCDSGIVSAYFDDATIKETAGKVSLPAAARLEGDVQRRIVAVLHEWVRLFPADFRNKKIMQGLNDVIKSCQQSSVDSELTSACASVLDCVSRGISNQESYERELCDNDVTMQDCDDLLKWSPAKQERKKIVKFVLMRQDATQINEFARQLSLIELEFLKHVGAEELMQMFTADGTEDSRTNLGASVSWSNRLSSLVATVVCMCRKRKQARDVITFFARVADRCCELSNFNSSVAIWTGLTQESVVRLKKTWSKIKLNELHKMEKIFSPARNFREYRRIYYKRIEMYLRYKLNPQATTPAAEEPEEGNRFSIVSSSSATFGKTPVTPTCDSGIESGGDSNPESKTGNPLNEEGVVKVRSSMCRRKSEIIVPFLVLLMKDVYNLINHTTPTTNHDGRINLEKLERLSRILRPIEDWKRARLTYQRNEKIRNFLLMTPVYDQNDLFRFSYKREAPSCRAEKDNLRYLKSVRETLTRQFHASMNRSKTL